MTRHFHNEGDALDDAATLGEQLVTLHDHAAEQHGQITDPIRARQFIRAGRAIFTLVSKTTGARFTYNVNASEDGNVHFVAVLRGSDNSGDYDYLGTIRRDLFAHGKKSRIAADAKSAAAFKWVWQALSQGHMPRTIEFWHEGACGRCGRRLTVPASIESGFGPECITKVGA
jgi:hypothetical protein